MDVSRLSIRFVGALISTEQPKSQNSVTFQSLPSPSTAGSGAWARGKEHREPQQQAGVEPLAGGRTPCDPTHESSVNLDRLLAGSRARLRRGRVVNQPRPLACDSLGEFLDRRVLRCEVTQLDRSGSRICDPDLPGPGVCPRAVSLHDPHSVQPNTMRGQRLLGCSANHLGVIGVSLARHPAHRADSVDTRAGR
jgi:hypothetical protein